MSSLLQFGAHEVEGSAREDKDMVHANKILGGGGVV